MSPIIEARGLSKSYGNTQALRDVNFELSAGSIVGLIGPNGAGKTTILKAILGLTSFDGELKVLGLNPREQRMELMQQVCFIADVAILPRWLKVADALTFVEGIHPNFNRKKAEGFLAHTKIHPQKKVKQLSKGMVAQLHLALVMSIDAKLLVLDEPTLGLDILYRREFYSNLLNDYFDDERTIVITTHQVEEVEHILTELLFVKNSQIALQTNMDAISDRYSEVLVAADRCDEARALGPLDSRELFGQHVYLFEDVSKEKLERLGEVRIPSVADLFVGIMKEPKR